LNYFYWLLAGISTVNFGVYLTCASWYRYKDRGAMEQIENGGEDDAKGKVQMVEI
jgi:peptide/histidine transporter 3/4